MTEPTNPEGHPRETSWYGLSAGTVLADRYRIERLISRGGMGAVFEATQLGLDRAVAIKVLLPTLSRDDKVQERFRREARSVASLHHPNIIQVYDYGISDFGPYIVMEYLRGQGLRQLLRRGPLAIERALELTEQVCSAVSAAHSKGIIHRDLKPDNIIIEEQSNGEVTAKVLDFGVAKIREAQQEESEMNLTGANIIGSPAYMSPEQSMGLELDARSDIYSLGIVLYEMLTGSTPFGKASSPAMLVHQINSHPPQMSEFRSEITPALEFVVMKALAKDRDLRFATAHEFAHALRTAYDDPSAYDTQLDDERGGDSAETRSATSGALNQASPRGSRSLRRRLAILP
ncbi:MAG: serine/threonine protein kinase, partial [Blastocatellia bacterium]|nr:serine/threonine protein kinase [Blastocatellia bacterium]